MRSAVDLGLSLSISPPVLADRCPAEPDQNLVGGYGLMGDALPDDTLFSGNFHKCHGFEIYLSQILTKAQMEYVEDLMLQMMHL